MTGPARLPLFHFGHGHGPMPFLAGFEYVLMADRAVVIDPLGLGMDIVAEDNRPRITGHKDDIGDIRRKGRPAHHRNSNEH